MASLKHKTTDIGVDLAERGGIMGFKEEQTVYKSKCC